MVKPVKSLKFKDPKTKQYGEDTPIGADAINIDYKEINVEQALDNINLTKSGSNIILTKPNGEQDTIFMDIKKNKKQNQEDSIVLFNDANGIDSTFSIEEDIFNYSKLDIYLASTYGKLENVVSIDLGKDKVYNLSYNTFNEFNEYVMHFITVNFDNKTINIQNADKGLILKEGIFEESYLASTKIIKIIGYKK